MSLSNLLGETVWICPFCEWSLLVNGDARFDHAGIERALEDHLDTDHKGWTIQKIWETMTEQGRL